MARLELGRVVARTEKAKIGAEKHGARSTPGVVTKGALTCPHIYQGAFEGAPFLLRRPDNTKRKNVAWVYEGIPSMTIVQKDGTRHVSAKEKLTYEECERYLPLRDGDVVFCPSVHDGDSFRICFIDHRGNKVKLMGRLSGVDTAELRGSSEKEKSLALRAKKRLEDAVADIFITIRNPGVEKFGRPLSDVEVGEIKSVTNYMLADPEICVPYSGGKKQSWG